MQQFSIICDYALYGKELQEKLNSHNFKYSVDFLHTHRRKTVNFIIEANTIEDIAFLTLLRNWYHS